MSEYNFLLPLTQSFILPGSILSLHLDETESLEISDWVLAAKGEIFVFYRPESFEWSQVSFPITGVRAKIHQVIEENSQGIHCLIEGLERAQLLSIDDGDPKKGNVVPYPIENKNLESNVQILQNIREEYSKLLALDSHLPDSLVQQSNFFHDSTRFINHIVSNLTIPIKERQKYLEESNFKLQLETVLLWVVQAFQYRSITSRIFDEVSNKLDDQNKRYYLKEQIKRFQAELNQANDESLDEISRLEVRLKKLTIPEENRTEAQRELLRMRQMHSDASEYNVSRNWLECVLSLPWSIYTEDMVDLKKAQQLLDTHHYGLEKPKARILEQLAVLIRKPVGGSSILCFVGPPGVGKTSLGQSIATAMGRKCHRIALGGIQDEAEIRGHRRTYVGSMPGRLIQALRRIKCSNPVIILDEIDKIGRDVRGDPSSALLELLDPEQNSSFVDHYLDMPFDCSQILFVCTANTVETIPPALSDRLEVIRIPGYTQAEKLTITEKHLLSRLQKTMGISPEEIQIKGSLITRIIEAYTEEAGVRNLYRSLGSIYRKGLREIIEGAQTPLVLENEEQLHHYLGPPRALRKQIKEALPLGVALGLAWTPTGGEVLYIESILFKGTGKLQMTGQLGEVMKESAAAAISVLKNLSSALEIPYGSFSLNDFHIHVPEGSIPKDGPSAGITIFCALYSALSEKYLRPKLAMTGEITLRGSVLPVGGIKEKCLSAHRLGIQCIVIPKDNRFDFLEVPLEVRDTLEVHFVETIEDVLSVAFVSGLHPGLI